MHPVKILSHPGSVRKQREEFAEARSYKSREAATRRIDETNPSQLSIMLFAHS